MYYTPTVIVPGFTAHGNLGNAVAMAKRDGTYVMDNDFNTIDEFDFRVTWTTA